MSTIVLDYTPQPRQLVLHTTAARQIFYGGSAGGGKMAPVDSTVWTPFGPKRIGSLKVGDQVSNPDGGVARVIAVWPQGVKKIYRVTCDDGASCEAGLEHLWLARRARLRRFTKKPAEESERWKVMTTATLIGELERGRHMLIPLTEPVEFTVTSRHPNGRWPVPPYSLGALIGDGHIGAGQLSLTSADPEIVSRMRKEGMAPYRKSAARPCPAYFFGPDHRGKLDKLSLTGCRSWEKFIPPQYKIAPLSMRWALIQGLMDTDGYADSRGHASFTTASNQLALDVQFLVRSLGFKANITSKTPTYKSGAVKKQGRLAYTVWIKGGSHEKLFYLPRKRRRAALKFNGGHGERARRIVSIEPSRECEAVCITVDHPNGLYLTNDFIVTHNSHSLRWDAVQFCLQNPGLQAYLFRRTLPELEDNHIKWIQREIPREIGVYNETRKRMEFFNGSNIFFCFCEKEQDVWRYLGAEMHWTGLDEATRFTESQIALIKSRSRLGGFRPHPDYAHSLPRFIGASNPGGPSHSYWRSTFIDPAPPETLFFDPNMRNPRDPSDKGWSTIFIPAKMRDNKYIDANYEAAFSGLPPELAKAYRDGDWDAVVGQALHNLHKDRHMLRTFEPPRHWTRFMSLDWGTARPFAVGWFCVSDGAILSPRDGYPEKYLPSGAIVMYAEWYGWNGRANQGCRLDGPTVARRILDMETTPMDYRIADSEMWSKHDGPSTAERMMEVDPRMILRPAQKDRKHNYNEFIARLAGNPTIRENGRQEEHPMFFATVNCRHFWRTVPILTLDETDPEKGPDTKQEDHCLAGETLVETPEGQVRVDELPERGKVWTTDGWRDFVNLGQTIPQAPVWRVGLDNGSSVRATANHRFLTPLGYVRLDELSYGGYVVVSQPRRRTWRNTSTARHIGSAATTIKDAARDCIVLFGSITTVLYRRAITSITKMATAPTTIWPILSLSSPGNTYASTPGRQNELLTPSGTWKRVCARWLSSGTSRKKGGRGTESTPSLMEGAHRQSRISASFAAMKESVSKAGEYTVRRRVSNESSVAKILSITRDGTANVHDLHVPGAHNFAVNGGVIVHNCYDMVSYALRSRPYVSTEEDRWYEKNAEWVRKIRSDDPYATT